MCISISGEMVRDWCLVGAAAQGLQASDKV
jgi:hypothetical protein